MTFVCPFRISRTPLQGFAVCLLATLTLPPLVAAEDVATLASILSRKNRETYDAISAYVAANGTATDADKAYRWLFESARREGWEADALPLVDAYRQRPELDSATKVIAQQVQALGLARQGKPDVALDAMDESLAGVGLRSANEALDFATALATAMQTGGKPESAKLVYERLTRKFFLNPGVRQFCENRAGKLELLGKPSPDFGVEDLDGKPVAWADFAGKVVLVDFWATNCPPCLEEFPSLKQLHADYQKEGFEVVGISLDDDRSLVDSFQQRAKLPWRLALSKTDRDATRERFKVVTIPSMFLVDSEGRVQYVDVRGPELRRVVERTLKKAP